MVCDDDEEGEGSEYLSTHEEEQHLDVAEESLNLGVELTFTHTMNIRGQIGEQDVMVLIDCQATQILISNKLIEKLDFPLCDTRSYGIVMGSKLSRKGKEVCRGVQMW